MQTEEFASSAMTSALSTTAPQPSLLFSRFRSLSDGLDSGTLGFIGRLREQQRKSITRLLLHQQLGTAAIGRLALDDRPSLDFRH